MSQYPVINAGTTPTVAVLQAMLPQNGYKSGDQSVTSSTTLVNDTALLVPLAANATYWFDLVVSYTGGTTGSSDLRAAWAVPTSATMAFQWLIASLSNATQGGQGSAATTLFCGSNGATVQAMSMRGSVVTSSTAGNLQFKWAQNTSSATATVVKAGSILLARRVA